MPVYTEQLRAQAYIADPVTLVSEEADTPSQQLRLVAQESEERIYREGLEGAQLISLVENPPHNAGTDPLLHPPPLSPQTAVPTPHRTPHYNCLHCDPHSQGDVTNQRARGAYGCQAGPELGPGHSRGPAGILPPRYPTGPFKTSITPEPAPTPPPPSGTARTSKPYFKKIISANALVPERTSDPDPQLVLGHSADDCGDGDLAQQRGTGGTPLSEQVVVWRRFKEGVQAQHLEWVRPPLEVMFFPGFAGDRSPPCCAPCIARQQGPASSSPHWGPGRLSWSTAAGQTHVPHRDYNQAQDQPVLATFAVLPRAKYSAGSVFKRNPHGATRPCPGAWGGGKVVSRSPPCRAGSGRGGCGFWFGFLSHPETSRLGNKVDPELRFDGHIKHISKKASHRGFPCKGNQFLDRGGSLLTRPRYGPYLEYAPPPGCRCSRTLGGWTIQRRALRRWSETPRAPPRPTSPVRAGESSRSGTRRDASVGYFPKAQGAGFHTWWVRQPQSRHAGKRERCLPVVIQWRCRVPCPSTNAPLWAASPGCGTFSRPAHIQEMNNKGKIGGQTVETVEAHPAEVVIRYFWTQQCPKKYFKDA
ncbi:hypothetical protein GWK47_034166 [Chionoecetes opilio]|uniref:Uncharacterized protein n=1 Tax=Chionoecetes opilio TaxID=41210 RepID=A0A8J4YUZ4_CHIOP|nr:hypothetical protein GWK47_034166 [Chionoecetes opilio]